MTTTLLSAPSESISVTDREQILARNIDECFFIRGNTPEVSLRLHDGSGREVELPRELVPIVLAALRAVREGGAFSVGVMPEELTTSAAAKMLNVSRPTLMKMIKAGRIKAHMVGTHHRLATQDVLALRRERIEAQQRAVLEMMDLANEHGDFR